MESDGRSGPEALLYLEATDGADEAHAPLSVLQAIRIGNLIGNSWDHFLSFVSGGRLGR